MHPARSLIEILLTRSELEAAINGCLLLCKHHGDSERGSESAQLSARYHDMMTHWRDGTISQEDYRLERARINRAMLDLVQKMPAEWTDAPLKAAGFSVQMPANSQQKSFLRQWGLAFLLIAGILGIAGLALHERIFPKKETIATQPNNPKSDSTPPVQQPEQSNTVPKKSAKSAGKSTPSQVRKPVGAAGPSVEPSIQVPLVVPKPDSRFRSYGKTIISDGMERGKVGDKMAFRNVQTGEILCCYADAEDFSGGKANVSKNGIKYFYINKNGVEVE